jgi:hypothetical protein
MWALELHRTSDSDNLHSKKTVGATKNGSEKTKSESGHGQQKTQADKNLGQNFETSPESTENGSAGSYQRFLESQFCRIWIYRPLK